MKHFKSCHSFRFPHQPSSDSSSCLQPQRPSSSLLTLLFLSSFLLFFVDGHTVLIRPQYNRENNPFKSLWKLNYVTLIQSLVPKSKQTNLNLSPTQSLCVKRTKKKTTKPPRGNRIRA
ncbi:hypothetical protein NL108_016244 [Boleophthalmus pectinirostris]|nr:hypothetical protein NL108_016244 [Boleophthalmus pectinirostris]